MKKRVIHWLFGICALWMTCSPAAYALDPRDAIALPERKSVLQYYYFYYSGHETYRDGKLIDNGTTIEQKTNVLRYTYAGPYIGKLPWAVNFSLPYGDVQVDGNAVSNKPVGNSGFGDATAILALYPLADRANKHYVILGQYVTAPTGKYANSDTFNMGANIWAFKTEAAWLKAWGPLYLQLVGNVKFHTDNNNYGTTSKTRKKDPLYGGEVHLSYDITPDLWISGSYFYENGGQTTTNDVPSIDKVTSHKIGIGMKYKLTKDISAVVMCKPTIKTENGTSLDELVKLSLSYTW